MKSVEEAEKEKKEKEKLQWLEDTFKNGLGISPTRLLEVFRDCNKKYKQTSIKLIGEVRVGAKLSGDMVSKLINKLYEEYPAIYETVLEMPTKEGKVVRIKPRKLTPVK